jgi:predicted aldo/keto reductase-like oxidoreductase
MLKLDRRSFLRSTAAGAGCVLVAPSPGLSGITARAARSATDRVTLGKTGVEVSFLAQGTGFNGGERSSAHTRLGQEQFSRLIRHSFDQGVNFFDMADLYGSHSFVKNALKGVPRDKYAVLSQIWPYPTGWITPSGGAFEEVDRFRREAGVEVIDVCLIHCMMDSKWPEVFRRVRDELSELKQKGGVRAVGVSCHDYGALKIAAAHPWVDVILARINHKGGSYYSMDSGVEEVAGTLRLARSNGKAIIGMKIFGAGRLVKAEEKDASLRYVLGSGLIDAMTVGMLKIEEVDDSIKRINLASHVQARRGVGNLGKGDA